MSWLSKKRYLIGLLLPTLIIYTVYIIAPIIMAIGYSFTKYSGIGKATFNGLTNYKRLLQDDTLWISFKNTMIIFGVAFVLLLVGAFFVALLLNNHLKFVDTSKALIFSPAIIAPIIVGIIWVYILDPHVGLINGILDAIGYRDLNRHGLGEINSPLIVSDLYISGSSWDILPQYI